MTTALEPGLVGEARRAVTPDQTARAFGSGDVDVLGTPGLLALIEEACVAALHGALPPEQTSVGMRAELDHLSPSRVGAEIKALARLVAVERRTLTFEAEAFDGDTLIGRATHKRAVVDRSRFE